MRGKMAEHLDKANAELAKAIQALDADDYDGAAQAIANTIDSKHDAVTCLPDVGRPPGKVLPFFPVYELFDDKRLPRAPRAQLEVFGGDEPEADDTGGASPRPGKGGDLPEASRRSYSQPIQ